MKQIIFCALVFFTASLCGCGYSTSSLLPPELDSIYVENFTNAIDPSMEVSDRRSSYYYRHALEVDITNRVIDKFVVDKNLDIKSAPQAALLLKGSLVDLQQFPVSYDDSEEVEEFRTEVYVDLELHNLRTGKVMWTEKRFMGQSDYTVTGPFAKSESASLEDAVDDLAQRILERVIEAW